MSKLLTIIIPAYNMEKYLEKNLDSLVLSSIIMKKMEIIVVNDGSQDKTSHIAHRFESIYGEVVKVIDKNNGNYGSCINVGLKMATGIFVKILDADDSFHSANLESFINELEKSETRNEEVDLFFMDYHTVNEEGSIIEYYSQELPINKVISVSGSDCDLFKKIHHHCIAYRTSVLIDNDYVQSEGIPYTDQEWITIPLLYVKRIKYLPIDLYQYLLGRDGQTMDKSVLEKSAKVHIQVGDAMVRIYLKVKSNSSDLNMDIVKERIVNYYEYIYKMFLITNSCNESRAMIREADAALFKSSIEIYDALGNTIVSRKLPIKYIKCWRKRGNSYFLRILIKLVKLWQMVKLGLVR